MSKQLAKSTSLVGSMTLISRIVGFVRDMLVAQYFGAGAQYDAFLVAFKLPNFFRSLLAEGAFSQSFVPLLAEYRDKKTAEETKHYINACAGSLAFVVTIITILGVWGAPFLVRAFAPGFEVSGERFDLATEMLRITFPYLLLITMTAFVAGILNTYGKFTAPAFAPTLLNIAMIATMVWLTRHLQTPIMSLAWGVILGGVLQFVFQLPFLYQIKIKPRPKLGFKHEGVQRLLRLMVPLIYGASILQVNLLINTMFASMLPDGSISWLYYAERMMQFPLGVFGVALSTVALTHLSKGHAQKNHSHYNDILDWSMKFAWLIALPAAVGLGVLARPILVALFQYGKFTANDVTQSEKALIFFAIGLLAFIIVKVLSVACYAKQDMKGPVQIATISLFLNVGLNAVLMQYLAHAGLALSTSVAATMTGLLLYIRMKRRHHVSFQKDWISFGPRVIVANIAMGAALYFVVQAVGDLSVMHSVFRAMYLTGYIVLGVIVYVMTLLVLGFRPRHVLKPIVIE